MKGKIEIKTSEKMNEVVKEQLIFRGDHLSKYAAKRIEELEEKQSVKTTSGYNSEKFTPPFRVGKKQGRTVLDSNGMELVHFFHGDEKMAENYVRWLND